LRGVILFYDEVAFLSLMVPRRSTNYIPPTVVIPQSQTKN